ncbi:cellulose binding domain-containing protein [Micromonospora matsumotoense]|uniref:cellulose binding domain-containing protein n=1 Tax=Micromonospora matsumotoense TaxID=121616 RepID=UPI003424C9BB
MLRTFGVVLATTTLTLAGWAGTLTGAQAQPAPAATPTPGPTYTCPPALPVSGQFLSATTTSITIRYSMILSPPCGYDPPITVVLFASREDATVWRNPVASAVSGPERYGDLTVAGLTPDSEYWFRFSAGDKHDPYVISGPVRTLAVSSAACQATVTIDNRWTGGYAATVSVRNTSQQTLNGWQVTWRWSGDERISALWNGVASTSGADVTVRNASYNGTLTPGGSTTFGMLVWTSAVTGGLTLTCGR